MTRSMSDVLRHVPGVMVRRDFLRLTGASVAYLGTSRLLGGVSPALADVGGALALFTWQGYELTDPSRTGVTSITSTRPRSISTTSSTSSRS